MAAAGAYAGFCGGCCSECGRAVKWPGHLRRDRERDVPTCAAVRTGDLGRCGRRACKLMLIHPDDTSSTAIPAPMVPGRHILLGAARRLGCGPEPHGTASGCRLAVRRAHRGVRTGGRRLRAFNHATSAGACRRGPKNSAALTSAGLSFFLNPRSQFFVVHHDFAHHPLGVCIGHGFGSEAHLFGRYFATGRLIAQLPFRGSVGAGAQATASPCSRAGW
jgi:hypothetical protein